MLSLEQLTQEALSLPSVSRAALAEKLIESLEFDIDPAIQETIPKTVINPRPQAEAWGYLYEACLRRLWGRPLRRSS